MFFTKRLFPTESVSTLSTIKKYNFSKQSHKHTQAATQTLSNSHTNTLKQPHKHSSSHTNTLKQPQKHTQAATQTHRQAATQTHLNSHTNTLKQTHKDTQADTETLSSRHKITNNGRVVELRDRLLEGCRTILYRTLCSTHSDSISFSLRLRWLAHPHKPFQCSFQLCCVIVLKQ